MVNVIQHGQINRLLGSYIILVHIEFSPYENWSSRFALVWLMVSHWAISVVLQWMCGSTDINVYIMNSTFRNNLKIWYSDSVFRVTGINVQIIPLYICRYTCRYSICFIVFFYSTLYLTSCGWAIMADTALTSRSATITGERLVVSVEHMTMTILMTWQNQMEIWWVLY